MCLEVAVEEVEAEGLVAEVIGLRTEALIEDREADAVAVVLVDEEATAIVEVDIETDMEDHQEGMVTMDLEELMGDVHHPQGHRQKHKSAYLKM